MTSSMAPSDRSAAVELSTAAARAWQDRGGWLPTPAGRVFVIDHPAAVGSAAEREPIVVLHGFPTSSFDFAGVLDALASTGRRVVLFDFLGFGLSDKPDVRYGIDLHADTTLAVLAALSIERCALVTHDMGDTVGGEVLARTLGDQGIPDDPAWAMPADQRPPISAAAPPSPTRLEVTQRIITNGSIYLDLAELTAGQQILWSAPDERLEGDAAALVGGEALGRGLSQVCSPDRQPSPDELAAMVELVEARDGHLLLARLIRYLDDRRRAEVRYTGAIETHPSPLTILWAQLDPVARAEMGDQLLERRPDAALVRLGGVGHYPMVEDPATFGAALVAALAPR